MSKINNCRICMKLSEDLKPLDDEYRDIFYSLTQIKVIFIDLNQFFLKSSFQLIKIENYSNSICSLCCKNLKSASNYRIDLINVQQKIFKDIEEFSGTIFDPINCTPIPTTSDDLNTVLLIKQEPVSEILQNSLEFLDEEQWEDSSDENQRKMKKYQKRKKTIETGNKSILCNHCDKPIKKYYYKKHLMRLVKRKNIQKKSRR